MNFLNSFNLINNFRNTLNSKIRKIYLKTSFYNNKISKVEKRKLVYKPKSNIIHCLVKYEKSLTNIEDLNINSIWSNDKIENSEYKKLHSFFWLFTLDLKSSKKVTQFILENWIDKNSNYNFLNWEIDILSKRVISWISNSQLTYEDSSDIYKDKFNFLIKKQTNHLINEINRSDFYDDKMIGCTAIILAGLSYKDTNFIKYGFELLNKIINYSLDDDFFPKSRSFRQLVFYLKYLVLIRELCKDSHNEIPEYLNEAIFYLGQGYKFYWQDTKQTYLFNGSHEITNIAFDDYLKNHGYKFSLEGKEFGGYVLFKDKKSSLIMDVGKPPEKKFSDTYQSGPLSFELIYNNKKVICNSGYFQNPKHQLNDISRSTASQSTLIIDNTSVTRLTRNNSGKKIIKNIFKITDKNIYYKKNSWMVTASHDGYLKEYGLIHKRSIEFDPINFLLIGADTLIKKKNYKSVNFEIRFHLYPNTKVSKTLDQNSALINLGDTGWKFTCGKYLIDIESGLFFGKKNSYIENNNIFISGKTDHNEQVINWRLEKI